MSRSDCLGCRQIAQPSPPGGPAPDAPPTELVEKEPEVPPTRPSRGSWNKMVMLFGRTAAARNPSDPNEGKDPSAAPSGSNIGSDPSTTPLGEKEPEAPAPMRLSRASWNKMMRITLLGDEMRSRIETPLERRKQIAEFLECRVKATRPSKGAVDISLLDCPGVSECIGEELMDHDMTFIRGWAKAQGLGIVTWLGGTITLSWKIGN